MTPRIARRWIVLGLAGLGSVPALACPLTDWLTGHYGISAGGFEHAIPEAPARMANPAGTARIVLRDMPLVADGFHHTVVLDAASRQAWILRTGGFASVYRWYGPVEVPPASMSTANCRLEPMDKGFAHEKGDPRSPST